MSEPKTWTWLDKSGWERGPWDAEPDKVQWKDERTGLTCIAVRHPEYGHWCGLTAEELRQKGMIA